MTKQTIATEIDIPDGYEFVRIVMPLNGDWIVQYNSKIMMYPHRCNCDWENTPCIIIRPIWQPPSWMRPGWIAMDSDGCWYWYSLEPKHGTDAFLVVGTACRIYENGHPTVGDFTPPPCDDRKQSKRRIGGAE